MKKRFNLVKFTNKEISKSKMKNIVGGKNKTPCYCVCRCSGDAMDNGNSNGSRRAAY